MYAVVDDHGLEKDRSGHFENQMRSGQRVPALQSAEGCHNEALVGFDVSGTSATPISFPDLVLRAISMGRTMFQRADKADFVSRRIIRPVASSRGGERRRDSSLCSLSQPPPQAPQAPLHGTARWKSRLFVALAETPAADYRQTRLFPLGTGFPHARSPTSQAWLMANIVQP